MSVDPTLTISIDRSGMPGAPADLVMSGKRDDDTPLGIVDYIEPALQPRLLTAPPSNEIHGDQMLGWVWQQTLLSFAVAPNAPADEDAAQNALDDLRDAITQGLTYTVTVTKNGGTNQVWTCNPGSLAPAGPRTRVDLALSVPVWSVSLPCYPVRS